MKKKVLFTASIAKHIIRFHMPYLQWFRDQGFEVHVACTRDEIIPLVDVQHDVPFIRSPFHPGHVKAYKQLKAIIDREDFAIIHCHTPMASIVTRLAARDAAKKGTKVLYTAHGFHFYKGAPLFYWLTFYPIEIWSSKYNDAIITINGEDYDAIKKVAPKDVDIYLIPGIGVAGERFFPVSTDDKIAIRKKNGYAADDFILVYAAEFIDRKNHAFIINAAQGIINAVPDVRILFAGRGELDQKLQNMVKSKGLEKNIIFLGFRNDIQQVFQMADIGISSSKQEGLPINLVEEMLCGIPIVATQERGHNAVVDHGVTGYLYPQNNKAKFAEYVLKLYNDRNLLRQFSAAALKKSPEFELKSSLRAMEEIYKKYI